MPDFAKDIQSLRERLSRLENSRWIGPPANGGLPACPRMTALPTAGEPYAYRFVSIPGTPDITYQCLRDAAGAWEWAVVATGTP